MINDSERIPRNWQKAFIFVPNRNYPKSIPHENLLLFTATAVCFPARIRLYTNGNTTAVVVMANAEGCDSTITLNLTILPNSAGTDLQTACDSYTWIDGNTYTENNTTATFTLESANGCDSIVTLDLTILHGVESIHAEVSCGPYTWDDGNTYSIPGIYSQYFTAANGCDSVAKLSLMILSKPEVAVAPLNEFTLEAQVTGFANFYSWIDCSASTAIPDAFGDTLVLPGNGSYAVVATGDFCSDTSECITITNVSLEEQEQPEMILFPNPATDGFFTIMGVGEGTLLITDMNGRLVPNIDYLGNTVVSIAGAASGVYMVRVITEGKAFVGRLVVE
jgi:hypothetical protein